MARPLVIVESPAKAKTIARFLGDDFDVRASVGHVADRVVHLRSGEILSVDVNATPQSPEEITW